MFRDGQAVHLPPKAVELLIVLVERSGKVVSKEQLMDLLWQDAFVEDANLTQNIFLLRKVFAEDNDANKYIETIPRRGYRFAAEVQATPPARIITEQETEDRDELQPVRPEGLPGAIARRLLGGGASPYWQKRKLRIAFLLFGNPSARRSTLPKPSPSSATQIEPSPCLSSPMPSVPID